ncbi:type I polyketide synthase [Actinoplanes utahensis]|uniref:Uncharacterized protein n=1 Tax=Actinoplanes utahensis TaxID=1869 RepID=A0A0A6XDU4_ACTUT|nr:type I polyketide synthase [Actinoplanes utahensis]KHD78257.1 hypothetical protein MB27_05240 [Actinoplanes utahensis]GIF28847.1 hypothetical protein Aut01nite_18330 [Actinoplanes utahensis]
MDRLEPIAVVGLACRFPGAADAGQFWHNLVTGTESVTFFSDDELRAAGIPESERTHPDYVPAAPTMPDADRFDAGLFGMTAHEARLCDPQFRVFLETCHAALENAGYDPFATPDSVGVFASVGPNGYHQHQLRPRPDVIGPSGVLASTLNQSDYASTLVSYKLGLRGPALTVLTACSSTLVGIHLAAQSLRAGECDTAVAGGAAVRVPLVAGHRWTPGGILTDDGHCRPFDVAASGTLWGSGAAAVILKRLDDAVADGDRIRAVLLGSAVNNDGADKVSFSAPSVGGQIEAICEAMTLAGVSPCEVDLVEAHATGTALGDPVEIAALTQAYRLLDPEPPNRRTVLGAVKSNIGHLGAVAGIAGFIKTILSMEAEAIPGTVHLRDVNPLLELDDTRFELAYRLRTWPRDPARRRIAAVTSLGIGGTNAHAVLAEGPLPDHAAEDRRPRLVVWSARTSEGEQRLRADLADHFSSRPASSFADAVATLQHGRTAHPVRGAAVCDSAAAAAESLRAGRLVSGAARDEARVAYLFPGQGVAYARMATGLYGTVPEFTVVMDECLQLFEEAGIPLYKQWTEGAGDLDDPLAQQPLVFSVGCSLGAMWRAWTGPPAAVLGHSLGELTAATVAGVWTLPEAVRLVAARATAMAAHPVAGGMFAVAASLDEVSRCLPEGAAVAAVNGDRQVVVSGSDAVLAETIARLSARDIAYRRTGVPASFHHPAWQPAARAWAEAFAGVQPGAPAAAWYSAAAGARIDAPTGSAGFWTGQLTAPVRFHDALGALLTEVGPAALLEAGPGGVLTGLARVHPSRNGAALIRSLGDHRTDHTDVLEAAGRLWVLGVPLDWNAAGQFPPKVRAELPAYPYERTRYWVDAPAAPAETGTARLPEPEPEPTIRPEPAAADTGPVSVTAWHEVDGEQQAEPAPGTRALILLPTDTDDALRVVAAVRRAALQPIRVTFGDRYADTAHEFKVRPAEPADLHRVVAALADRGMTPDVVIHATGYGRASLSASLQERLETGVLSLLALARTVLGSTRWAGPPRIVLLAGNSVDVTGGELVDPARAALHGLFRTLIAESPRLRCTGLDADDRVPVGDLARAIALGRSVPVLALRGRRVWAATDRPVPVPPATGSSLREEGVYLITGGAGALGLSLAQGLAATGLRPRIALLGRRDPEATVPAALAAIEGQGARIRGWACDVTDPAQLSQVVDQVTAAFGPVSAVFHLAGVAGDRMLAFRERSDAAAVLAPKTIGTAALEEIFARQPALDFAVFFSSRAAVEGLVGGGDYAAANAYLDAASLGSPLAKGRVLSVAWPVWRGAGMADTGVDLAALHHRVSELGGAPATRPDVELSVPDEVVWERVLGAAEVWALDEHRVGRVPLLPGTAYLDMMVSAYRERVTAEQDRPVRLRDVVFRAPFLDNADRVLRIRFRPAGEGHDVSIESRRVESAGLWTGHVSAHIRLIDADRPPAVDLQALRLRFGAAGDLESPSGRGRLFTLGPRWRNVTAVSASGDEKLIRVELPEAFRSDLAEHVLHPALLDTVAAAVRGPGQASSVPFHYELIVVHAPLPATFHAHVRRAPGAEPTAITGDIDVIGDDGALLVRIQRFTMLMVSEDQLRSSAAEPDSRVVPVDTAAATEAAAEDRGLDPSAAVAVLLGMLDAGLTGPVHVAPAATGLPRPSKAAVTAGSRPAAGKTGEPRSVTQSSPVPETAPVTGPVSGGSLRARLRDIWLESLGVTEFVEDQDFFEAGGNSLTAVELAARIRGVLGIELRIGVLLEARTFAQLHEVLARSLREQP